MDDHELDILKAALVSAVLEQYSDIPPENEIKCNFSKAYKKNVKKMIPSTKADMMDVSVEHIRGRTLKFAIIAAILLALIAGSAVAIPYVRERLVDVMFYDTGDFYIVTVDPEQAATAPESVEEYIVPTFIPEGFQITNDEKNAACVLMTWEDAENRKISFSQFSIPRDIVGRTGLYINSDGAKQYSKALGGYQTEIVEDADAYSAVWTDNMYFYCITISKPLGLGVVEDMIVSMPQTR